MARFGITMDINGVYPGINICEHRILFYIDPNQSDDKIKNQLAYGTFTDFAFSKPLTLSGILDDCIKYKIIPIVNLCITEGTWEKYSRLTSTECAKIGGLLRDYLKNRGFKKEAAYIGLFNEPNTHANLTSKEVCDYTNALHDKVGADFDVVYGNDEFYNLDWNYLGQNCRAKVMGIHFLSCLGSWQIPKKNWHLIKDCKTIANIYGKKLIGIECGSWFKDYQSEGHQINLEIMAECKKYDIDCLIVLPDTNQKAREEWKLLGYRVWNSDFTKMVSGTQAKFDEFIDFIKKEGTPVPNILKGKDGMIIKTIGHKTTDVKSGYGCLLLNETLNFLGYLDDIYVDFNYSDKTRIALEKWQTAVKSLYNNAVDGRCGRMTWRYFKKEVKKIDIEVYKDLSDDLEILMSPYNTNGDT